MAVTESDLNEYKNQGYEFVIENGKTYIVKEDPESNTKRLVGIVENDSIGAIKYAIENSTENYPYFQYDSTNHDILGNFVGEIESSTGKKVETIVFNQDGYEIVVDGKKVKVPYADNGSVNLEDATSAIVEKTSSSTLTGDDLISEDNIEEVTKYLNENISSGKVEYEIIDGECYVIYNGEKIKVEKGTKVSDFIKDFATNYASSNNDTNNNQQNNSGNGGNRGNQGQTEFNIAIDLDTYSTVVDTLNKCTVEMQDDFSDNYDSQSLTSSELKSFYSSHYGTSYTSKLNEVKTNNNTLSTNIQTALMYYLSIDQSLASNMDTIIDDIFAGKMNLTEMSVEGGNTSIDYSQLVELLGDSSGYFTAERVNALSQFIMKFKLFSDKYQAEQVTKILDNYIETAFLMSSRNSGYSNEEEYQAKLTEFKNEFAVKVLNNATELNNYTDRPDCVPSLYWEGVGDEPPSDYEKALLYIAFTENSAQYIVMPTLTSMESFNDRNKDLLGMFFHYADDTKWYFKDLYNSSLELEGKFKALVGEDSSNYENIDPKALNDLIQDYIDIFSAANGHLEDNKILFSPDDNALSNTSIDNILGMVFCYGDGYVPSSEDRMVAFLDACELYFGYDYEQTKRIYHEYTTEDGDTFTSEAYDLQDTIIQQIYDQDGINGLCKFLSHYYNNLELDVDFCSHSDDFITWDSDDQYVNAMYPAYGNVDVSDLVQIQRPITPEFIKSIIFKDNLASEHSPLLYKSRIQNIDTALTSLNSFLTDFRSELASIKTNEETAQLYFAKKLDTSSVTDAMREKAKAKLKENGFTDDDIKNHIDSWMFDAYSLMLYNDDSGTEGSPAWLFCHKDSKEHSRAVLNDINIQARAYDAAKDLVDGMTGSWYVWATISGFFTGFGHGVANFVNNVADCWAADGLMSEFDYKQQFIHQLFTSDYSFYNEYDPKMLTSDYGDNYYDKIVAANLELLNDDDVMEMIAYAEANHIPQYELEHMIGLMDDETYSKYKTIAGSSDAELAYFKKMANRADIRSYTNVVYSVGSGVGNMAIPLALSILSSYCPPMSFAGYALSAASILATSAAAIGRTREEKMRAGETDDTKIWINALLHGLIEGAGEAIFGGVLNTKWGAKIFDKLTKIPVLGKVFSYTDDLIGKIDNLPFGSKAFKQFLKNDVKEIFEELGENGWSYVVDGVMFGDWPTAEEVLTESWQTIWQTALTTPILNGISGAATKFAPVYITVNGAIIKITRADIENHTDAEGNINYTSLIMDLSTNGKIEGKISCEHSAKLLNKMFGNVKVVSDVTFEGGKYKIVLANGTTIETDINDQSMYSKIIEASPEILTNALESNSPRKVKKIISNMDPDILVKYSSVMNAGQLSILMESVDGMTPVVIDNDGNYIIKTETGTEIVTAQELLSMQKNDTALKLAKARMMADINSYFAKGSPWVQDISFKNGKLVATLINGQQIEVADSSIDVARTIATEANFGFMTIDQFGNKSFEVIDRPMRVVQVGGLELRTNLTDEEIIQIYNDENAWAIKNGLKQKASSLADIKSLSTNEQGMHRDVPGLAEGTNIYEDINSLQKRWVGVDEKGNPIYKYEVNWAYHTTADGTVPGTKHEGSYSAGQEFGRAPNNTTVVVDDSGIMIPARQVKMIETASGDIMYESEYTGDGSDVVSRFYNYEPMFEVQEDSTSPRGYRLVPIPGMFGFEDGDARLDWGTCVTVEQDGVTQPFGTKATPSTVGSQANYVWTVTTEMNTTTLAAAIDALPDGPVKKAIVDSIVKRHAKDGKIIDPTTVIVGGKVNPDYLPFPEGTIQSGFNHEGGGVQCDFPISVDLLYELGFIELTEVTETKDSV